MSKKVDITPFGTATLGSVIDALKAANPGAQVVFDFCGTSPTTVASYRGWYDHLALGWSSEADFPSVATVLTVLESAISAKHHGYKGGEYTMRRDTPLWVDNWGDCSGTGIVGVEFLGDNTIILQTAKVD